MIISHWEENTETKKGSINYPPLAQRLKNPENSEPKSDLQEGSESKVVIKWKWFKYTLVNLFYLNFSL